MDSTHTHTHTHFKLEIRKSISFNNFQTSVCNDTASAEENNSSKIQQLHQSGSHQELQQISTTPDEYCTSGK